MSPEKHPCGCSLHDLYTFSGALNGLRTRHVGYKGATTEAHLGFSDMEATADPDTWSLARGTETKAPGSRLQGELQWVVQPGPRAGEEEVAAESCLTLGGGDHFILQREQRPEPRTT